jgi:hypothetical protein
MWGSFSKNSSSVWISTSVNRSIRLAVDLLPVPENISNINSISDDALSDGERRGDFLKLQGTVQFIIISPWHQGTFNGSKQNANFWLSPGDAQAALADQMQFAGWESCLVFMVAADKAANLATKLESLLAVFPHADLAKALRQAQALAENETTKVFISGIKPDDRKGAAIEQMGAFSSLLYAKQNLAVSEAVASDQGTKTILEEFKAKRLARLDEIKTKVESIADQNGPIENVLYLTGGNLDAQLRDTTPPNENAPLCCLLAIGGEAANLAPLVEVLGL